MSSFPSATAYTIVAADATSGEDEKPQHKGSLSNREAPLAVSLTTHGHKSTWTVSSGKWNAQDRNDSGSGTGLSRTDALRPSRSQKVINKLQSVVVVMQTTRTTTGALAIYYWKGLVVALFSILNITNRAMGKGCLFLDASIDFYSFL